MRTRTSSGSALRRSSLASLEETFGGLCSMDIGVALPATATDYKTGTRVLLQHVQRET
jgi:hypothetical protein